MRRCGVVLCLSVSMVVLLAGFAEAGWVTDNCYTANHSTTAKTREEARSYGYVAVGEGYEWGGGCWNDDDVDNTPGQPDSGGEGPDCSGLVFKSWYLKSTEGQSGWHWWSRWYNIHGPYKSDEFHDPAESWPFHNISKSAMVTLAMDAFAKQGHASLLYVNLPNADGTDYIMEALGDAYGTDVFLQTYRSDSRYNATRRLGWAG